MKLLKKLFYPKPSLFYYAVFIEGLGELAVSSP